MQPLSFTDAAKKLARFGIRQEQVYLIDLVLLVEMAWADGKIQVGEIDILLSYLDHHVDSINRLAGCEILKYGDAREFVARFLEARPEQELLDTIREVIPAIRIANKEFETAEQTRIDILNACLDIAASSVTTYPYGLKERFTADEKAYYHKLTELLYRPAF
jgi:hypothetical protein